MCVREGCSNQLKRLRGNTKQTEEQRENSHKPQTERPQDGVESRLTSP